MTRLWMLIGLNTRYSDTLFYEEGQRRIRKKVAKAAAAAASMKLFSSNFSLAESIKSSLQLNHSSIFHPFSTILLPKIAEKEKREIKSSSSSSLKSKAKSSLELLKKRTRSVKEFDDEHMKRYGDKESHVPVMLGEVLDVFPSSFSLRSFVDCTLGAAGHSSASFHIPSFETGCKCMSNKLIEDTLSCTSKCSLGQATLRAEDILNSWPATEVGRILQEYGEESNWYSLQNKIVKARLKGGLHSTTDLVDLIRTTTSRTSGGRQGWIKTSARVFQALRIAVNDELRTLEASLHACFNCLAPGGRLAVISFHSLEDRIVKQTFLNLSSSSQGHGEGEGNTAELRKVDKHNFKKEAWIKQIIEGSDGIILTKRPITASLEEERLNCRSRSAKLRVIQKV
ncbi:hypothetical protein Ancab_002490 [Ancistrocladus abbreviatus]